MDEAVSHENGKPVFYMQDLTFTHLVVDKIPIPLSRQTGDHYSVYFAGTSKSTILLQLSIASLSAEDPCRMKERHNTSFFLLFADEGKIYKIVQWRDPEGESRSELIDILEGTYPEPVRAMDISSAVSVHQMNGLMPLIPSTSVDLILLLLAV